MTLDDRIRAEIEARIRSGEWRPGHRIPFEHELVAHYGCARATVNKALTALAAAGLIERRRKAGSFVAQPHVRSAVLAIPDIGQMITARGDPYRYEVLTRRIRKARRITPEELLLRDEGALLAMTGVHIAADTPFAFESRVISLTAVPAARDADFGEGAPGSWLLEHVPWTDARHRISAVGAVPTVADALAIAAGLPCLQLERWTWRQGAAVTFVRQIFPADRYDLIGEFTSAGRP